MPPLLRNPPRILFGRGLAPREAWSSAPDWVQASEPRIARALARALARPSGGWVVVDASRAITERPRGYTIEGAEWVAWRADGAPHVAPAACPHMGADLCAGRVAGGKLVCPWHGLALGPEGHGAWRPRPTHDDGVLVWARLADGKGATAAPILPPRPARFVDAVIRMEARCEPADIVANRLDPWHGVHYHPHSFASLSVLDVSDDVLTLRVAYRVAGPFCMEVDATFHSPEPNTIVMTIVGGEGVGSVVETHATPIAPGRSAVVEATLATSDRLGFAAVLRSARLLRPAMEKRAARLWAEDLAYAERRYALRERAPKKAPTKPLPVAGARSTHAPKKPRSSRP